MHAPLSSIARLIRFIFLVFAITSSFRVGASESVPDQNPPSVASLKMPAQRDRLTLVIGPYVWHTHTGDHNDIPRLVGLEWEPAAYPVEFGVAYFRNSFYQDSVYAYVGKRWFLSDDGDGFFVHLSGGPLYGYRGEYEDKVPFNHHGVGVAIIPGIGYQYRSVSAQVVVLGTAALMITFGYDFKR